MDASKQTQLAIVEAHVKRDHYAEQFSKMGAVLLEETERINVITLEQFQPFIELFRMNKSQYADDKTYRLNMNALYIKYISDLSINRHQPTIVIQSIKNPVECYYLDRLFTRIKADNTISESMRDTVPGAVPRASSTTREDLLINASTQDIMSANSTPEQIDYFRRVRAVSAFVNKRFVERNLNPELRDKLIAPSQELGSIDNLPGTIESFDDEE